MNAQAPLTQHNIPPHVKPEQVVDFDVFGDYRYAEADRPHDALLKLADDAGRGIFWTPHNGGHWFVNAHELIFEAMRTPEVFSSKGVASLPPMPPELEPWLPPLSLDAPEHMKYRMPIVHAFSPDKVKALEADIRAFAGQLIDAIAAKGRCEFVDAVAEPLPIIIFMKLMGMDTTRLKEFRTWVKLMPSGDVEERLYSHRHINEMMTELIAERRARPKNDLVSQLIATQVDGKPLDDRQMHGVCMLLFAAGLDTVANSLALSMEYLARNPALQARLRASRALIPEVVEELLRRHTVTHSVRLVSKDAVFHGASLKKDDRVLMVLPLGNMDPEHFPNATQFDADRELKTHLAFGAGPHRCAGSHLARLEMNVFCDEWFKRMPNVRLDPAHRPEFRTSLVYGVDSLHLLWDTAPRPS
jgi:cytochrome P450